MRDAFSLFSGCHRRSALLFPPLAIAPCFFWTSPAFEPTVRDGNLFGRGTADDKGQVHIHIKALESLQKVNGKFPINVKVLIEGEEEVGSVSLWDYVQKNKEKLRADALVVSDTSMLGKGVPSITYGLRGLNYYQLELTGPVRDLHSGVYGGAVPNPLTILTELFAKLHDRNFRITAPGFYDDVAKVGGAERKALNSLPWKKKDFEKAVGAPGYVGEKGFTIVEQLWTRPTLELNGIWGGYTGEGAKTVIPSKAYAKFSTRLVPDQDPSELRPLIEGFLRQQCPDSVEMEIVQQHSGKPYLVKPDSAFGKAAQKALSDTFGQPVAFIREGGSVPITQSFKDILGIDTLLLGLALPDCKVHSPNENFSIENFHAGKFP